MKYHFWDQLKDIIEALDCKKTNEVFWEKARILWKTYKKSTLANILFEKIRQNTEEIFYL